MATVERRLLQVQALPEYPADIGTWLWAMQEVRRRTLRLVTGLDQRTLDWEGLDGRENAIGSLLYHIAHVELGWLFGDILLQSDFPASVKVELPFDGRDADGRLTPVLGVPLDVHMRRMSRTRETFLDTFREIPPEEWRRLRDPQGEDYSVTPEWAVFHLVEHEAGHAFQISSLKARAARRYKST